MTTFTILLAGTIAPTARLRALVRGTRVIAADAGMRHAKPLGVAPELWVGDFDSAQGDLDSARSDPDVPRETHPALKDATDGALAVHAAQRAGATRLVVVGPFGGRTDHSTLHLLAAFDWATRGLAPLLTDGREEALVLGSRIAEPDWPKGTTFSVLAFDRVSITLRGCRWPLANEPVDPGSSLTLSNVVTDRLEASATGGRALLIGQAAGKDRQTLSHHENE